MRICCISAKKLIVLKLHKKWAFFALEINRCKKLFKRIKCYSSMILIQSECSMSCYICWSVLGWGAAILHASAYRKFPADLFFCFHSISVHFNFFISLSLSLSLFFTVSFCRSVVSWLLLVCILIFFLFTLLT